MYEASFMSSNTLATSLKKFAQNGRPHVEITLDEHNDKRHTYTTFDSLSGTVAITSPTSARFDEVIINLEGLTKTFMENMSPVASQTRLEAKHLFLKLSMPISDSEYPQPRIAEAGQTYRFPFNFVIPAQMLPTSCVHDCMTDHVRDAHLRLPPSIGPDGSGLDDGAPDMANISYAIKVVVTRTQEHDGKTVTLVEKKRNIRILPSMTEAPPMHISADDKEYNLISTKTLKKGMFKGKLGHLTLSAAQTKAIAISPSSASPPTIMATLKLRFDPSDPTVKPPRLGSLTSKIKTSTFFAIKAVADLPMRPVILSQFEVYRRVYSENTPLASRCIEAVPWTFVPHAPQYARRDSGYSTCSSASSSSSTLLATALSADASSSGHYEASVLVPLTLPASKTWLPTFHSCLVSRIYALSIALTAHTPGTGVAATTLSVKLPVELVSDPTATGLEEQLGDLSVAQEVDADMAPRVLEVPREEFVGNSALAGSGRREQRMDAPPGYESLPGLSVRA